MSATPATPAQPQLGEDLPWVNAVEAGLSLAPLDVVTSRLRKQVEEGRLPGFVICVVKGGKLLRFDSFGCADASSNVPLRHDALFRLFSQTKPVTIVAFMRLWELGLVLLEDPVSKYIPAFADAVVGDDRGPLLRPITIRDLLAHTSGIGFGPGFGYEPNDHYERPYADLVGRVDRGDVRSLEEWCAELARVPLLFQPGSDWGYGYSSDVLGRVAEVISNQPLDVLLRSQVLDPLGMAETAFAVPPARAARLAALHSREPCDGTGKTVDVTVADPGGACSSSSVFLEGRASQVLQGGGCVCSMAGGLVSSFRDYVRFSQMLLRGGEFQGVRILQEQTVALLAGDWLNANAAEVRESPLWVWETAGLGFSPFGQVGVPHPDAPARRAASSQLRTVCWGGAGGSSYMLSWPHELMVLTYTGCIYDTATQEAVWKAVVKGLRPSLRRVLRRPAAQLETAVAGRRAKPIATPLRWKRRPGARDGQKIISKIGKKFAVRMRKRNG